MKQTGRGRLRSNKEHSDTNQHYQSENSSGTAGL
jgi:hypothetical protein